MNLGRMFGRAAVIAIAIVALAGAKVTWAVPVSDCLGAALSFSLLSFAADGDIDVGVGNAAKVTSPLCFISGEVGAGNDVALGNNGLYSGDAITFGSITLDNYAKVLGECVTDGGSVTKKVGASCGSTDTTGSNGLLGLLDEAYFDGGFFACDVAGGSPTSSIPAVNIAAGKQLTITDTVSGGLNLIDVPSLTLGNSSTLTLSGGSTDTLVLRVDGNTSIVHGAKIVLAGGLTPFSVVIAAQGGISFWGNSTTINGTMLVGQPFNSGDRACPAGSGATINGALLCEDDLSMGLNARVNYEPAFLVHVPSANCSSPE
jgi:hypothetical protein